MLALHAQPADEPIPYRVRAYDSSLNPVEGVLLSADPFRVQGPTRRTTALGSLAAFIALEPDAPPVSDDDATLFLTDGRRVLGKPAPSTSADEVAWNSTRFGPLTFDAELVRAVAAGKDHPPGVAADADVILLRNGDRLEGFVDQLADPVLITVDGTPRSIPFQRVAAVMLANPATPPAGPRAWLLGGDVVAATLASFKTGAMVFRRDETYFELSPDEVLAYAPDAAALVPLSSLSPSAQTPAAGRRWTPPLRVRAGLSEPLDLRVIELPGPMVVEWTLPPGSTRMAFRAELPVSARLWGHCVLRVETVTQGAAAALATHVLSAESPLADFNAELSAPAAGSEGVTLRLTLDEGERGPIQDRVILHDALILTTPTPPASPVPPAR